MTKTRLAIVTLLALLGALLAPASLSASGATTMVTFGSRGACALSSGNLVSISAPVVKAKMESGWASSYTSQYVRVTATLQGLRSGTWSAMTNAGATTKSTTKVSRAYVSTFRTLTPPAAVKVPATGPDDYRQVLTVQWYSPSTGKVVRTVRHVVGQYSFNGTLVPRCRAALPPSGLNALTFVATGANNQGRAVMSAPAMGKARVLDCRPHCGTASTALPAGPAMDRRATTVTAAIALVNGRSSAFSARTCLAAHRTICSPFRTDATTPYGPIPAPKITVTVAGSCLNWKVNWSGNGKAVTATVSMDGTSLASWSAAGSFEKMGQKCVGYSTTKTLVLKVQDSAATVEQNSVRGTVTTQASGTTGPHPPEMSLFRAGMAAQCSGMPECAWVGVTTEYFVGSSVNCRVVAISSGDPGSIPPWTQATPGTTTNRVWMAGYGAWMDINCSDGSGNSLTRHIRWS